MQRFSIIVVSMREILDNIYQILLGSPTSISRFAFSAYRKDVRRSQMELIPVEDERPSIPEHMDNGFATHSFM